MDVTYRFGGFSVDSARRLLFGPDGRAIALKPRVFDTLLYLVEHRGELLEKQALLDAIWPNVVVEENNLNKAISTLRGVLGETRDEHRFVVTEPGRGYRFVARVEASGMAPDTQAASASSASVDQASSPRAEMATNPARRGALLLGSLVFVAAAALAAVWLWLGGMPATESAVSPETPRATSIAAYPRNSIAVLPFDNLSPDRNDAYFAVALHEEVINRLVNVRPLSVIRAPSVARYAGTSRPFEDIGSELHVGTVLEATVAYADRRIALNATLTEVATGRLLWSERYEGPLVDAFAIQGDIASRIAAAVAAELVPGQLASLQPRPTDSPEAYALYLRAISLTGVENSSDRIIELLTQAIAFDDGFSSAYARRATAYAARIVDNTSGDGVSATGRLDHERLARADAERALELDATSVEAREALAIIDAVAWHWTSARAQLESLLPDGDLATSDVATSPLPIYRFYVGDEDAGILSARRAVELNPNDWLTHRNLAWVLQLAGDSDGALDALRTAVELAPDRPIVRRWMAYVTAARGDTAEALNEIRLAERLLGDERPRLALAEIAKVYGQLGQAADAQRLFDEIMAAGDPQQLGAGTLAAAYLAIGDTEQSLAALRVAAEKVRNHEPDQGFWNLMHLVHDVTAHPTVARPEFREVLSRIRGD